jgi:hypothetical protein
VEASAHKTSLTPHHVIVAHVPSQESEQYCNCVLGIIDIEKRFCIFLRYFYFILKLLRQCDILCFLSFHFITEIWRIISYQACIRCYLGILSIYKNCKHRVCIDQIVEVLSIYHEIVWLWVLIKGWNKLQWYIVIDLLSGFAGTWFI